MIPCWTSLFCEACFARRLKDKVVRWKQNHHSENSSSADKNLFLCVVHHCRKVSKQLVPRKQSDRLRRSREVAHTVRRFFSRNPESHSCSRVPPKAVECPLS